MTDWANHSNALNDLGVLVTRPEQQADKLCVLIEMNGFRAIRFPTLEISSSKKITVATAEFDQLHRYDWIIFVSVNAVRYAQTSISGRINSLDNIQVAAIGHATATTLSNYGIRVDLVPEASANSEALLACSHMQQIAHQRFMIVRGEGGRALLGEKIKQRGGTVFYAEVYKRNRPDVDSTELKQLWTQNLINIVTITSGDALQNLVTMLGNDAPQLLNKTPVVVISQRLETLAQSMGITRTLLAENAADQSILKAITHFRSNNLK